MPPFLALRVMALRGIELREVVYRERVIPRHTHATAGFCLGIAVLNEALAKNPPVKPKRPPYGTPAGRPRS